MCTFCRAATAPRPVLSRRCNVPLPTPCHPRAPRANAVRGRAPTRGGRPHDAPLVLRRTRHPRARGAPAVAAAAPRHGRPGRLAPALAGGTRRGVALVMELSTGICNLRPFWALRPPDLGAWSAHAEAIGAAAETEAGR